MSKKKDSTKKINKKKKKNKKKTNIKKSKKNNLTPNNIDGISIITVTNRLSYMDNIFENYHRQKYEPKELIIILNKNSLDASLWNEKSKNYSDIKIYKLDEKKSLGYCLNFGVKKTNYKIVAKFDDDDYYGPNYLINSIKAFEFTDAGLIGKRSHLVYFESSSILAIRNPGHENCYDSFVNGSTFIINKDIFKKVKFPNISIAEDTAFCNSCNKKGIKIYSTDRFDHVYIRHKSKENHTWKIEDDKFLKKSCKVIQKVDDYRKYCDYHQLD